MVWAKITVQNLIVISDVDERQNYSHSPSKYAKRTKFLRNMKKIHPLRRCHLLPTVASKVGNSTLILKNLSKCSKILKMGKIYRGQYEARSGPP